MILIFLDFHNQLSITTSSGIPSFLKQFPNFLNIQLNCVGDSGIASVVIEESKVEGEDARKFLEDVRVNFPQVCKISEFYSWPLLTSCQLFVIILFQFIFFLFLLSFFFFPFFFFYLFLFFFNEKVFF